MKRKVSKVLSVLLIAALMLSFTAVASAETRMYATRAVNVRSGPSTSYYIFKDSGCVTGPYKNAGDHMNLLFAESDKAEVITDEGATLVSGDKIIMLYSKADQKYYFVVINGNEAKAHNRYGSELFALNVKLLDKLPQHGWSCGENLKAVSTRNEIKAFKK